MGVELDQFLHRLPVFVLLLLLFGCDELSVYAVVRQQLVPEEVHELDHDAIGPPEAGLHVVLASSASRSRRRGGVVLFKHVAHLRVRGAREHGAGGVATGDGQGHLARLRVLRLEQA